VIPERGRPLDRWIAENVFGRDPATARLGLHEDGDIEYFWGYPIGHDIAPAYSTTHAYHQVVDALRPDYIWLIREDSRGIGLMIREKGCDGRRGFWEFHQPWELEPMGDDPRGTEEIWAWGVCACVWKMRNDGRTIPEGHAGSPTSVEAGD
jgi:hypothetical protein